MISRFESFESNVNYYPFGMLTVGRTWVAGSQYRFGFNGMENDDEIAGNDNALDFGSRIYDARIGRWLKTDKFEALAASWTPYRFGLNNAIRFSDSQGEFEVDEATAALYPNLKPALLNLLTELQKPENEEKVNKIVALAELGSKEKLFEILTDAKGPKLIIADLTDYSSKSTISYGDFGDQPPTTITTNTATVTETGKKLGVSGPVLGLTNTLGRSVEIDGQIQFSVTSQTVYLEDALAAALSDLYNKRGKMMSKEILMLFNGAVIHEIGHYGDEKDGKSNSAVGADSEVGDAIEMILQGVIVKGTTILHEYEPKEIKEDK